MAKGLEDTMPDEQGVRALHSQSFDLRERVFLVLGLTFLLTYAMPIVWSGAPSMATNICSLVQAAIWVIFAADFTMRLIRSASKIDFIKSNWVELFLIAVPALRPLRLLRALAAASVLTKHLGKGSAVRTNLVIRVGSAALLLWLLAALAITDAERGSGNISNFGEGMWWGLTTMTTVGYGDAYPTTISGKLIAAGLMIVGIALLSVITASFASWIIEQVNEADRGKSVDDEELEQLRSELSRLRAKLKVESPSGMGED